MKKIIFTSIIAIFASIPLFVLATVDPELYPGGSNLLQDVINANSNNTNTTNNTSPSNTFGSPTDVIINNNNTGIPRAIPVDESTLSQTQGATTGGTSGTSGSSLNQGVTGSASAGASGSLNQGVTGSAGAGYNAGGGSGGSNFSITFQNPLGGANGVNNLETLAIRILDILTKIGSILVIIMIVLTGYKYVVAQGNPAKLTKAHESLRYTLLGAVLVLGAYVIAQVICNTANEIGGQVCNSTIFRR
jgi:hypothetical protein